MEMRGVIVIDVEIGFENEINLLAAQGLYPKAVTGAELRAAAVFRWAVRDSE